MNNKPQIKDVFDIDEIVSKYGNKIFLVGGVGSGKSTWVTEVLVKKGSVLFVTSRKAKVLEDIECSCFSEAYYQYTDNNQTLITNARLAKLVERIADDYMQDIDEFIAHFDYVVIDEVHSIATDSAYADSCAPVLSFIEHVAEMGKTIMCMTGTPEPVQSYFDDNGWHTVDYTNICDYVHPKRVSILQNMYAVKCIADIVQNSADSKIIYFVNHLDSITEKCNELLDKGVLTATEIAVSVAKGREKTFFEDLCARLKYEGDGEVIKATSEKAYASIISKKMLPDECKILFSTSVLKEGINIMNPNMVMFCENHILSSLIQYFGRVREGGTEVYIIEDSKDHSIAHSELLYNYAVYSEAEAANRFYEEQIKANPFQRIERKELTKHLNKNPYIYFDYIKDVYKVFDLKFHEEVRLKEQYLWLESLSAHCRRYGIEQRWFDKDTQKKHFA